MDTKDVVEAKQMWKMGLIKGKIRKLVAKGAVMGEVIGGRGGVNEEILYEIPTP